MGEAKKKSSGASVITAEYEKDTKRFSRYSIGKNKLGLSGTLYMPKDKDLVESVIVKFAAERE